MDGPEGGLHALLEVHYPVDILAEHHLEARLEEYPLVVIPDSCKLAEGSRWVLLGYGEGGGSVLLQGERCARLFDALLGLRLPGVPEEMAAEPGTPAGPVNVNGGWQVVPPTTGKAVGYRYATRGQVGKGTIAAVYGPVALSHFPCHHPSLRPFVGDVAGQLLLAPAVRVDAPPCVDIALRRTRDGKLSLHLLNLAGAQRADRFLHTDFVAAVGPIAVGMRTPEKPKDVRWAPESGRPEWSCTAGMLSVTVPGLPIHGVLVVE